MELDKAAYEKETEDKKKQYQMEIDQYKKENKSLKEKFGFSKIDCSLYSKEPPTPETPDDLEGLYNSTEDNDPSGEKNLQIWR